MTKKAFLLFVLTAVITVSSFGAEELIGMENFTVPGEEEFILPKNTIVLSLGVFGAELSYERAFDTRFSVLGSVSYTTLIIVDEFTASAKARWYPFGGAFHLELGAGFVYGAGFVNMTGTMILGIFTMGWYFTQTDESFAPAQGGFLLQPGLGWKIDFGKPGGIVLPITAGIDLRVTKTPEFLPYFRLGLGWVF